MGHEIPDTDDDKAEQRTKGLRRKSYREQVLQLSQDVTDLRMQVEESETALSEQRQFLADKEDTLDILLTEGSRMMADG